MSILRKKLLPLMASAMLFFTGCGLTDNSSYNKATPASTTAAATATAAEETTKAEETSAQTDTPAETSPAETEALTETETAPEAIAEPDMTAAPDDSCDDALTEPAPDYIEYRFRSKKLLDQHYDKHGKEMGFASAADYEKAASDVINSPDALYKTEAEDGDGVYYIEETNEFAVLSTDGYIRTYFNPSGGKKYFDRQ